MFVPKALLIGLGRRKVPGGAILAAVVLVLSVWAGLGWVPPPLLVNQADGSYAVTDREGQLLRLSLSSDEKYRLWTPLEELPEVLQRATLQYEDRWFHYHPGVNPVALARAAWRSFIARDRRVGASTLTMQLARQRWRLKTHTLEGKLRQIAYALWLERHFSKPALLEAYLNLAPYGANIEGAGAAAWVYFRKPANRLTRDEARALALIPQNPAQRAPLGTRGKSALQQAWRAVYGDDPGFGRLWFRRREDLPLGAPHFAERLHELFGSGSLHSTLDPKIQGLTEDLLTGFIRQHRAQGIVNAAALVIHAPTMEVLGYAGSADYLDRRIQGYVNGLKARRSPGSTLKPFIYALGLDQGLITPDTLLKDTPLRVGEYQPENFERDFYGPLSATEALVRSRNIPAVALLNRLSKPTLFQFLRQAGLRFPREESYYGLTLAMGGAEVSMEELLRLYGLFANEGEWRDLRWLMQGQQPRKPAPAARRLLSPEAAFLVRQMLEANPRPQRSFGVRAYSRDRPVAWKTGTSSGLKDAWAVGLAGDLLAGVWLGNFDGTPNRQLVGRELAGPLLFSILEAVGLERPGDGFRPLPPPGLKSVEICPVSGVLRSPWCPHGKKGWIIPGVSPIGYCTVHRQIHVDPASGLRLCRGEEARGRPRVAEFWDSDELELFRLAGVRRDVPPPFGKPCEDPAGADAGARAPRILSPQPGMNYPIRAGEGNPIEFSAVASGGRHRLFWFVDDAYAGEGAAISWPGQPGQHLVRVVDDQGLSATTSLIGIPAR
jgi:penicillin-binding protein 1C